MVVAVGVDEDLEVIVVEDDRVVLGEGRPDVRLFQQGTDIEIRVVPEHLGARPRTGAGADVSLDVHEVIGPGSGFPGLLVELAVELGRTGPR